ncbi:hypothetical protein CF326_g7221 [Tilletia indica]|nr:hypothetical protein CF326_g7221 [Tilletia indica]
MFIRNPSFLLLLVLLSAYVSAVTVPIAALYGRDGGSNCPADCASQALQAAGCSTMADFNCLCNSQRFKDSSTSCVRQRCPASLDQAMQVTEQLCASKGGQTGNQPSNGPPGNNLAPAPGGDKGTGPNLGSSGHGTVGLPGTSPECQRPHMVCADQGSSPTPQLPHGDQQHGNVQPPMNNNQQPTDTPSVKLLPGTIQPVGYAPPSAAAGASNTTIGSGTKLPVPGSGTLAPPLPSSATASRFLASGNVLALLATFCVGLFLSF